MVIYPSSMRNISVWSAAPPTMMARDPSMARCRFSFVAFDLCKDLFGDTHRVERCGNAAIDGALQKHLHQRGEQVSHVLLAILGPFLYVLALGSAFIYRLTPVVLRVPS